MEQSRDAKANRNLMEALRTAQESLEQCEAFYGEANDDSCRVIYGRIKDMLKEQQQLVQKEIEAHREAGRWGE